MTAITYAGVVVTSIDVAELGGGKVEFDHSSVTRSKARFLKDLKETAANSKNFTAIEIDVTEAKNLINKIGNILDEDTTPLFCVHGYNVQPHDMLMKMSDVVEKFANEGGGHYYPIPVLWPCDSVNRWGPDKASSYGWDQEVFSQQAGNVLKQFVDTIDDGTFPRKSLMMHSMGNHVVFNGACGATNAPKVQFENIFMVAADLPFDIFHKNPNNNYIGSNGNVYANKEQKATNFFKMLARTKPGGPPKGKLCFLHYLHDDALWWSSNVANWEIRVGQRGIGKYKWAWNQSWYEDKNLVRDEIKGHYENYDIAGFFTTDKTKFTDQTNKHSYQFDYFAVEYYTKMSKEIKPEE